MGAESAHPCLRWTPASQLRLIGSVDQAGPGFLTFSSQGGHPEFECMVFLKFRYWQPIEEFLKVVQQAKNQMELRENLSGWPVPFV